MAMWVNICNDSTPDVFFHWGYMHIMSDLLFVDDARISFLHDINNYFGNPHMVNNTAESESPKCIEYYQLHLAM